MTRGTDVTPVTTRRSHLAAPAVSAHLAALLRCRRPPGPHLAALCGVGALRPHLAALLRLGEARTAEGRPGATGGHERHGTGGRRWPRAGGAGTLAHVEPTSTTSALDTADYRRQVHARYAAVRSAATPREGHAVWAAGHEALLRDHPASPVRPEHRGPGTKVPVAAYDPTWRFEVPVLPAPHERIEVRTGTDGVVAYERVGRVELGHAGGLDVWWHAGYGGGLFVPVRDAGSRTGGYGGGRYLLDTVKGADLGTTAREDGTPLLVVDLNFAYHPSCAYDPDWACPLAPPGNVLDVEVPVGEQYAGPWA